jgi:tetratricopeptide (TPR) repeat protein
MRGCLTPTCLLLAALCAGVPPVHAANTAVAEQAKTLYEQGVAAFKAGDFPAAAAKFQNAYNLDPSPILLYNLVRATEKTGDATGAVKHYKTYLTRFPEAEDKSEVKRIIEVLEAVLRRQQRKGRVSVLEVPPGAQVRIDDTLAPAPDAQGGWPLTPGRHVIQVTTREGHLWKTEVLMEAGGTASVTYEPATAVGAPPGPAEPAGPEMSSMALGGWVALGTGVAMLGGATFAFFEAESQADAAQDARKKAAQLPTSERDRLQTEFDDARNDRDFWGTTYIVLGSVGTAAALTGATLLVLDAAGEPMVEAALLPMPAGVGLVGRF